MQSIPNTGKRDVRELHWRVNSEAIFTAKRLLQTWEVNEPWWDVLKGMEPQERYRPWVQGLWPYGFPEHVQASSDHLSRVQFLLMARSAPVAYVSQLLYPVLVEEKRVIAKPPEDASVWLQALVERLSCEQALSSLKAHVQWAHKEQTMWKAQMENADEVHLYGSDETLEVLHQRSSMRQVQTFGHAFGMIILNASAFTDEDARDILFSMLVWNHEGCMAPQVVFIQGSGQARQCFEAIVEVWKGHATKDLKLSGSHKALRRMQFEMVHESPSWMAGYGGKVVLGHQQKVMGFYPCDSFEDAWSQINEAYPRLEPKHLKVLGTNLGQMQWSEQFNKTRVSPIRMMQMPPIP